MPLVCAVSQESKNTRMPRPNLLMFPQIFAKNADVHPRNSDLQKLLGFSKELHCLAEISEIFAKTLRFSAKIRIIGYSSSQIIEFYWQPTIQSTKHHAFQDSCIQTGALQQLAFSQIFAEMYAFRKDLRIFGTLADLGRNRQISAKIRGFSEKSPGLPQISQETSKFRTGG